MASFSNYSKIKEMFNDKRRSSSLPRKCFW